MTFLLELRDAAKADCDANRRMALRKHADAIEQLCDLLAARPDRETIIFLNGVWAYSERLLKESRKHGGGPPAPPGGKLRESARLAS